MAQEVVVRTLCDICQREDHEKVDATHTDTPTIEGLTRTVDLCDAHGQVLKAAQELLAKYGRKPDVDPNASKPPAGRVPASVQGGKYPCPECGHPYVYKSSMVAHRKKEHDYVPTEEDAAPAAEEGAFACRVCGDKKKSRKGRAAHEHHMHQKEPEDFMEDDSLVQETMPLAV